ncbi:hypothetical protein ACWC3X_36430 [Streptomyces populi]
MLDSGCGLLALGWEPGRPLPYQVGPGCGSPTEIRQGPGGRKIGAGADSTGGAGFGQTRGAGIVEILGEALPRLAVSDPVQRGTAGQDRTASDEAGLGHQCPPLIDAVGNFRRRGEQPLLLAIQKSLDHRVVVVSLRTVGAVEERLFSAISPVQQQALTMYAIIGQIGNLVGVQPK